MTTRSVAQARPIVALQCGAAAEQRCPAPRYAWRVQRRCVVQTTAFVPALQFKRPRSEEVAQAAAKADTVLDVEPAEVSEAAPERTAQLQAHRAKRDGNGKGTATGTKRKARRIAGAARDTQNPETSAQQRGKRSARSEAAPAAADAAAVTTSDTIPVQGRHPGRKAVVKETTAVRATVSRAGAKPATASLRRSARLAL